MRVVAIPTAATLFGEMKGDRLAGSPLSQQVIILLIWILFCHWICFTLNASKCMHCLARADGLHSNNCMWSSKDRMCSQPWRSQRCQAIHFVSTFVNYVTPAMSIWKVLIQREKWNHPKRSTFETPWKKQPYSRASACMCVCVCVR